MKLRSLCVILILCSNVNSLINNNNYKNKNNDKNTNIEQHHNRYSRKNGLQMKDNEINVDSYGDEDDDDDNSDLDIDNYNDDGDNFDSNEDFLFEDNKRSETKDLLMSWNNVDLCKDVKCKKNQYCVTKGNTIAVCVYKKEKINKHNDNYNKNNNNYYFYKTINKQTNKQETKLNDRQIMINKKERKLLEKNCLRCPSIESQFLCGNDNSTYSSMCRLNFHNCIHETNITKICDGFCPCPVEKRNWNDMKKEKYRQRLNKYWKKVQRTKLINKEINLDDEHVDIDGNNQKTKCTKNDLEIMKTRLLDWFPVVIADQKRLLSKSEKKTKLKNKLKKKNTLKIPSCDKDVISMFEHFDSNSDFLLTIKELSDLENDKQEKCLKQYLDNCDEDKDKLISTYEWCNCFQRKTSKPCKMALKHNTYKNLLGSFTPKCDQNGFYKSLQCHSSSGICWCVDKNGVEFANTRKRGRFDCDEFLNQANNKKSKDKIIGDDEDDTDDDADENDNDDDEETSNESEGSGDESNII